MTKLLSIAALAFLIGCTTSLDRQAQQVSATPTVRFVDIEKFDHDLTSSLDASFEEVNVVFYDKTSPNNIPPRMQKWIAAIEKNGGTVKITPPPNELTPKDPFVLFGLFGSLFSSAKALFEVREESRFEKVKGRDAVISLARNSSGDVVVEKVNFIKRQKP